MARRGPDHIRELGPEGAGRAGARPSSRRVGAAGAECTTRLRTGARGAVGPDATPGAIIRAGSGRIGPIRARQAGGGAGRGVRAGGALGARAAAVALRVCARRARRARADPRGLGGSKRAGRAGIAPARPRARHVRAGPAARTRRGCGRGGEGGGRALGALRGAACAHRWQVAPDLTAAAGGGADCA